MKVFKFLFYSPCLLFLNLWRFFLSLIMSQPWTKIDERQAEFEREPASKQDILYFSLYEWAGMKHRPHHAALRLSLTHRVIYVRPFYVKDILQGTRALKDFQGHLRAENPHLLIFEPILWSGEENLSLVWKLNRFFLKFQLLSIMKSVDFKPSIILTNTPKMYDMVDVFQPQKVHYDILDEYSAFSWASGNFKKYERETLKRAHGITAGTHQIYEARKDLHENVIFLPCGVDYHHFNQATQPDTEIPSELSNLSPPVLGYFGAVDERIDQELLAYCAEKHPEWQIYLIGPILDEFNLFKDYANIHLAGLREYTELPAYCKGFEVCLIPFVLNDITRNINPTKVLEYFAAEKPIVSVAIPDVMKFYGDVVYIGKDKEDFCHQVEICLDAEDTERLAKGKEMAEKRSWEAFAEKLEEIMSSTEFQTEK